MHASQLAHEQVTYVPLLRVAMGFWGAKVIGVAVELDLFGRLSRAGEMTVEEMRAELGFGERAADVFATACASLGLVERDGERLRNSAAAETYLVEGRPQYFGDYVKWLDRREYAVASRLLESLRSDGPVTWERGERDSLFVPEDEVLHAIFWDAVDSYSAATAGVLAETFDCSSHARVLDVGGGSGVYPIELCRRWPHLTATVYDLPFVCDIAQRRIERAGLAERIAVEPGDFRVDERLPGGHDLALLGSVLHDWDEPVNRALLRKCNEALEPGGTVVVVEILVDDDKRGPELAAAMSVNMLVETGEGKNYTGAEIEAWLGDAGFEQVTTIPPSPQTPNSFVVGRKPPAAAGG
ncbi:methyltransferase [Conexibacter woesei]|uniref:O-methyltransferase family 2 n=1 Tax=Conexibacter woesei (strain DSM 14684 / CCUG 47730 / CIP 108061 / JCM 11494 / NBRC 100937 / ID131577) TaxID=469383 RepID=D3F6H0_CONWI|nr:methyltransferase [Conexibacter woesei]ADB50737.1 O-methyltransferase family 2 [Conexibacter woesei DSM 14684]